MSEKYPAYAEYKKTHLGWLSQIPNHWEVKRLKYLGDAIIGLTYSPDEVVDEGEGTLVLRSSNVQNKQLAFDDNVYVNKKIPDKLVAQKGDILICARNGSRSLIGKNAQIDENAAGMSFGAFMSIFRSPYNDYLSKVFNSPLFEYQSGSFLTATINQLTTGNLNSFEIPLPTEQERKIIANFLDHETAKIDTLIEKQQQLIKLLKEKRQAVISHAVTKGLKPNALMCDSGVDMLGALPSSWRVKQVRYLLRDGAEGIKIGPFGSALKLEDMVDSGTRVYGQENVIKKDFTLGKRRISEDKFQEMKVYQVYPNDLLITMMGTSGKCELIPEEADVGIIDSHLLRLRVKETEILPKFFRLLIDECYEIENQIKISGKGSIMHGLNSSIVKSLVLPVPCVSEQSEILEFVEQETSKVDFLVEKAHSIIAYTNERRTALISAAVTGKIDVRNWQAPEPSNDNKEVAA